MRSKKEDKTMLMALLTVGLIVLVIVGSVFFYHPPIQRYEKRREMMGTYVRIVVYHHDEEHAMDSIDSAFDRIEEVNSVASRYNQSSELSVLNTQGRLEDASPMLVELIGRSMDIYETTDGAFDITITPLLNLWNNEFELMTVDAEHVTELNQNVFSESLRGEFQAIEPPIYPLNETPTVTITENGWTVSSSWQNYYVYHDNELRVTTNFWNLPYDTQEHYINITQQYVGSDRITIDGNTIELEEGTSLTLDGIAKGYAVDKAVEELKNNGIKRAFVDAGGDIATLGTKPEGEKWVIGLRNPEDETESVTEFDLSGEAIATSGNYERYFDPEAEVGHIMDPRTGRTVFKSSSATIISQDCTTADALATAIFVLGPENGTSLVNSLDGVESLVLCYEDPSSLSLSQGISDYIVDEV
ncbi:MAG: FAD:protein FMN transferase [Thermoplasmata archaeon]